MIFETIMPSTRKDKKYMMTFNNPYKVVHFGSKNSETYLDHHDVVKRNNYLKRHQALGEDWTKINPASASAFILWGDSTNLKMNLTKYLTKFNVK